MPIATVQTRRSPAGPRSTSSVLARERLLDLAPYEVGEIANRIFWDAMEEALDQHCTNPAFRGLVRQWEPIRRGTLESLPYVQVNVFKTRTLLSVPSADIILNLTSSGTNGQVSHNPLDQRSETWHKRMLAAIESHQGLHRSEVHDLLWLIYDPLQSATVAAVYSTSNLAALTPVGDRHHALAGNTLQVEPTLRWLSSRSGQNTRLRVVGLCPFLLTLLEVHQARGGSPLSFHPESCVLTGGGWKAAQADAIPREAFIARISQGLGIPPQNLRDHFGMVEHAVLYPECAFHRHHVPTYARVLIRHPGTLDVLSTGESGLLQVLTPMVSSMPAVSILTTDWAALDTSACPCGRATPSIRILGRAGVNKNRGCAISAAELLERA